jgi:OmpA-OmpF porin, OOP family
MKKVLLAIALFSVMAASKVSAQTSEAKNAIGLAMLWNDYRAPILNSYYFDFSKKTYGQEFWYARYISPSFNFRAPLSVSTIDYPYGSVVNRVPNGGYSQSVGVTLDAQLLYKFNNGYILKETAVVAPYLYLGVAAVGGMYDKQIPKEFDFYLPFGLGINWQLSPNVGIITEAGYRRSITLDKDNFLIKAGLNFAFGKMKDRDGDGVADKNDDCPDVAGLAAFKGCPDGDGDGIADKDDACPTVAGLAAFKGCPDTDADGITDAEDACPTVAGLANFKGCPDTDGDGVTDAEDECPNEKGLLNLKGCPDGDGDGIADKSDKCPTVKGLQSMMGCPDSDGDGITDADDACPTVAGVSAFNGCPDTDGDGVEDKKDKCPTVKGLKEREGCPAPVVQAPAPVVEADSDRDGIIDRNDKCPNEAGVAENFGCPVKKEVSFSFDNILFETGKSTLKQESFAVLDQVVKIMQENPRHLANVQGHTDSQGKADANQKLSEGRAQACVTYLTSKGIAASRLSSVGFGDKVAIADNKTAEGRARNRRVEFKLSLPK